MHLHRHARPEAERVEEGDDLGIGGAWHRDHRGVTWLERVERRHERELGRLLGRDRETVRAGLGPVERDEDPVLDLLGHLVLEAGGEPVGLVPGVAEHVGEEALDDAVAAHRRERAPAGRRR